MAEHDQSADAPASDDAPQAGPQRDKLWKIRHSTAHILATAVQEMFPDAKFAIGPPIADGFYYDFDLPRPLSTDDFEELERRMQAIVKANQTFEREQWDKDRAREFFADQPYKLELIDGIADEHVSIFRNGPFTDLCAGPHMPRTKQCKHFKLMKVAGAYWRGDEKRPMLQRVYGTAFATREELDQHLHLLEEARRRDHRRLARELELFDFHPWSPGSVFWRPKGWVAYRQLLDYFRALEQANGYEEICNPILYNKALFEQSGHWEHYREDMFLIEQEDGQTYGLKPMNCPDTMLYFGSKKRSYRDLPMRVAEFGMLHRNELAGALSGATRVRQFCQDDAHIFARPDQIGAEIRLLLEMMEQTYALFGLSDYSMELSTRPEKFMGDPALWESAEATLKEVLEGSGKDFAINEGDGAFYGPKIDVKLRDSLGRTWQCATIQLDFQLPRRFELTYTDAENAEVTPVVIHRALAGSLERFFAILVEHFAGAFPTWMAPVQAKVLSITRDQAEHAWDVADALKAAGVRVEVDDRNEKIGKKIAEAEVQKVPYMLVIGKREADDGVVAVRSWSEGRRGQMTVADLITEIRQKVAERTLDVEITASQLAVAIAEADDALDDDDMADRGY